MLSNQILNALNKKNKSKVVKVIETKQEQEMPSDNFSLSTLEYSDLEPLENNSYTPSIIEVEKDYHDFFYEDPEFLNFEINSF